MNKVKLMTAIFGVIAISIASVAMFNTNASAATTCVVSKASGFTVNADKTITGSFTVTGEADCTVPVNVMTWNADPALFPAAEFYTSQTQHDVKTQTFGVGTHSMTVKLPLCETDPSVVRGYQADVVAGANAPSTITAPGTPGFYWELQSNNTFRVVDYKLGDNKCPEAPEKGETTEMVSDLGEPTELANTGPGSTIAVAVAATIAGVLGYNLVQRKRSARQ